MIKNLGVIILAAGMGKRMGGKFPKVMFKLADRPIIDYVLDSVSGLDPDITAVIVGFGREQVTKHLSSRNGISFAIQLEQNGTGHAVQQAEEIFEKFSGTVLILNGDVPLISKKTISEFIKYHKKEKAGVSVLSADYENPFGYGRIIRDVNGKVLKIVEEKDSNEREKEVREINSGTFLFDSELLFSNISELCSDNAQSELYITDMIDILRTKGCKIGAWKTDRIEETFGINTLEQLEALNNLLKTR